MGRSLITRFNFAVMKDFGSIYKMKCTIVLQLSKIYLAKINIYTKYMQSFTLVLVGTEQAIQNCRNISCFVLHVAQYHSNSIICMPTIERGQNRMQIGDTWG